MKHLALISLLALLLGACSLSEGTGQVLLGKATTEETEALASIVRVDLEEALRSAEAHDDLIAATCYSGLLARMDLVGGNYITEIKGPFTSFQKVRNVRRLLTDGVSDELTLACAALRSDSKSSVVNIIKSVTTGGVF